MPTKESVRFAGGGLLQMLQMLGQELQRKQNLQQIGQARSQAFGPQVGVGGTPVDFNRNLGMGVRQSPSMGENLTPYVNSDITQVGGGGQAEFLRALLSMAAGNPQAKEQLGLESAFMPQPFTASPGQVFGTQDPITKERRIQGQVPMKPDLPEGFSQITDPRQKAAIFNKTYGTDFGGEVFDKPKFDRLISTFPDQKNQQIGVFQNPEDGSIYQRPLGDVRAPGGAKSQEQTQRLSALEKNLDQYQRLLTKVKGGRIGGTISKGEAAIEQNPSARAAVGLENTLTGLIARVIAGEVGVLTDQDIERAKAMLPKITDNNEERQLKFDLLKELIQERKSAFGAPQEQKNPKDLRGIFGQ